MYNNWAEGLEDPKFAFISKTLDEFHAFLESPLKAHQLEAVREKREIDKTIARMERQFEGA